VKISAKVLADSISTERHRLTTLELVYPRFIHGEFMTHRAFSRNASSSRATPAQTMISAALEDPAFFVEIGKNTGGMQAKQLVEPEVAEKFGREWKSLSAAVARYVDRWSREYTIHKQIANRALEPWQHIKVVVSSTSWGNFFLLRNHPDAQPEIHELAAQMLEALGNSVPTWVPAGDWHLPYISDEERTSLDIETLKARCARVSYLNFEGKPSNVYEDMRLYEKLVSSTPIHASPLEHQATPFEAPTYQEIDGHWYKACEVRNFEGWKSYRSMLEDCPLSGQVQPIEEK